MKKIVLIFLIVAVSLTARSANRKFNSVITKQDTVICKSVKLGFFNVTCKFNDGEKVKHPYKNVKRIYKNDRIFEMKTFYYDNESTDHKVMLEYIGVKNGLKVYKRVCYCSGPDVLCTTIYVFNGNELIGKFTDPQRNVVLSFIKEYTQQQDKLISQN